LEKNHEADFVRQTWDVIPYRRTGAMTITLSHFSAAAVFAFFASIVFGITHRDSTREMIRYGLYCFVMFLGGVIAAGWLMWLVRR
jgi:hypothetical protein